MKEQRVKLKICGMTRKQDIDYAVSLGVDAIGLIFYPPSPRNISINQAEQLVHNMDGLIDIFAVLVNPSALFVEQLLSKLPIHYLQFHGEESSTFCCQFEKPYIKTIMASSTEKINEQIRIYPDAFALLLDTPSADYGGRGQKFDWCIVPRGMSKPFFLAGGLTPHNIRKAIAHCLPDGVDVCSGVEVSPGIKDYKKMRQLVTAIRGNKND